MTQLICQHDIRREDVRRHSRLNGIDYLEVGPDQLTLSVYFLGKAPVELDKSNVHIEGGLRIQDIGIKDVTVHRFEQGELDDYMVVSVDRPGDFSTYTLRVVEQDAQGRRQPHTAFDPRYDRIDFSFKVDCPSDLDCKPVATCPPEVKDNPDINYLAKDYDSFRQLILDRLALVMPDWKERHVPDIGIALVEVLAYVGDHLSYYQDAVATEAYLDTARKRISVGRHARLVDYKMHEGCNARAWVCVSTDGDQQLNPKETYFITGRNDTVPATGNVLSEDDLAQVPQSRYEVFEPLAQEGIQLYRDHSKLFFYTWGDKACCLPRGTTHATLSGDLVSAEPPEKPPCKPDAASNPDEAQSAPGGGTKMDDPPLTLHLKPGDVLVLEEVIGPKTGQSGDADPNHRQAVRLTAVESGKDPLTGQPVVEISWAEEDALRFPLCLSALGPPPECKMIVDISIAWGNVILVDHGRTTEIDLDPVPEMETVSCCRGESVPADTKVIAGDYRPLLPKAPLTFSQTLTPDTPAARTLVQDARQAIPQVSLDGVPAPNGGTQWVPRSDLLGSGPDDQHFVAEIDEDGRAHLRFGDDESGEQPDAGLTLHARYRIGNGLAGNVGAEAISHMVLRKTELSGISLNIRNPLPAQGGTAPEPITDVKLFAPHQFRKDLQRAIIADDYAAIVEREFKEKIQGAAASLRWTGSWYEVMVAVDPLGRDQADPELLTAVAQRLHRYRRMGHDLVVKSAHPVPLNIDIEVCVLPNYLRGHIKAELMDLFSNRILPDGRQGFFHPDKLTFGQGVYLSKLVATAQAVEGVESIQVRRLQRFGETENQEIENGVLPLGPLEVARLDNDPSLPENGLLTMDVRGGR